MGKLSIPKTGGMEMHRLSLVAGAAAAFLVTAGWSVLQSAPVAPAAADKTLGMALMSATVESGIDSVPPEIIRGSGVVSASRANTGIIDVVFDRDLSNCTCTANVGYYANGFHVISGVAATNCPYASKTARVATTASNTVTLMNYPFHLIVFCPK